MLVVGTMWVVDKLYYKVGGNLINDLEESVRIEPAI